ncbi:MAG: chemotaxis protein CheD [Candidatus Omnitrophota bacterium]
MSNTIRVGMAQLAVAKYPDNLETQALGSCVGVALYDPYIRVGGILHAMLPAMSYATAKSRGNTAKFVDTAIDELLGKMVEHGASKEHIKAKIAGGANMFPDISRGKEGHIGMRNVDAAKARLLKLGIKVIAEETGGSFGRTIILDSATGKLRVRTLTYGEKEI